MGRVQPRQRHQDRTEDAIARAIQAYHTGEQPSIRRAAESQGIAYTTLQGRLKGRQSRHKAHELDQSLGDPEERVLVRKIEEIDRRGFPLRVDMVRQMAIKVLQQREQSGGIGSKELTLGRHWITRFLNRYTHLASKLVRK